LLFLWVIKSTKTADITEGLVASHLMEQRPNGGRIHHIAGTRVRLGTWSSIHGSIMGRQHS
jgi:hypothetical protein